MRSLVMLAAILVVVTSSKYSIRILISLSNDKKHSCSV